MQRPQTPRTAAINGGSSDGPPSCGLRDFAGAVYRRVEAGWKRFKGDGKQRRQSPTFRSAPTFDKLSGTFMEQRRKLQKELSRIGSRLYGTAIHRPKSAQEGRFSTMNPVAIRVLCFFVRTSRLANLDLSSALARTGTRDSTGRLLRYSMRPNFSPRKGHRRFDTRSREFQRSCAPS